MDPITTAAIASVLSAGLAEVGKTFVKKAAEPPAIEAAKPISTWLTKGMTKALAKCGNERFQQIGAPQDDDALSRYARNLGFDQLQAAGNDELRQDVARAALLMAEPDPQLVPEKLCQQSALASRAIIPILAQFLFVLRRELEKDQKIGASWCSKATMNRQSLSAPVCNDAGCPGRNYRRAPSLFWPVTRG